MIEPKANVKKLSRLKDFGNDRLGLVRLDKNERTTPFDAVVFKEMMAGIQSEHLTMYPDQTPLYKKLAAFHRLDEKQTLVTAGSDAAIKMIYETYIQKGDEVVFLDPTYAMIEVYADLFEAIKVKVGYSADLELDFSRLLDSVSDKTRAVFIANPNQPTGTLLSDEQFRLILEKTAKTKTLLIMDEAYLAFSGKPSATNFISQYDHLIARSSTAVKSPCLLAK